MSNKLKLEAVFPDALYKSLYDDYCHNEKAAFLRANYPFSIAINIYATNLAMELLGDHYGHRKNEA